MVIDISEKNGPIELQQENTTFTKVSIFMNIFNCHVNRSPLSGKIEEINYKPGKFFNASLIKLVRKMREIILKLNAINPMRK